MVTFLAPIVQTNFWDGWDPINLALKLYQDSGAYSPVSWRKIKEDGKKWPEFAFVCRNSSIHKKCELWIRISIFSHSYSDRRLLIFKAETATWDLSGIQPPLSLFPKGPWPWCFSCDAFEITFMQAWRALTSFPFSFCMQNFLPCSIHPSDSNYVRCYGM